MRPPHVAVHARVRRAMSLAPIAALALAAGAHAQNPAPSAPALKGLPFNATADRTNSVYVKGRSDFTLPDATIDVTGTPV